MTHTARLAAAFVAVAAAAASASASEPAGASAFSPPVEAQEAARISESEPAVHAPSLSRGPKDLEWTLTVLGGGYRGPLPQGDAVNLELGLGLAWPSFVTGLRLSLVTMGRESGYGAAAQFGPRLRLGDRVRLEILADLGVDTYSSHYDADLAVVGSGKTTGSDQTLPAAGLRAGVMLLNSEGRYAVTLGAMARWVKTTTVDYQSTVCITMFLCGTSSGTVTYGGAMVGGYLTITRLSPLGT